MASRDDKSAFANIDWVVIGIYLTLVLFGWMNIYASAYQEEHPMIWDFTMNYGKQMVWILAAFTIAFTILLIDPKFFNAFAFPIFGMFMLILAGVLVA